MEKAKKLWNLLGKSSQASETAHDCLGVHLKRPTQTRWNSLFDSLVSLLSVADKLGKQLNKLFCIVHLRIITHYLRIILRWLLHCSQNTSIFIFRHGFPERIRPCNGTNCKIVGYFTKRKKLLFRLRSTMFDKSNERLTQN